MLEYVGYLCFNFASAVGIIFVNKALFANVHFLFSTALTVIHYVTNIAGLAILAGTGLAKTQHSRIDARMLLLCCVVGVAPVLNNLSLKLNSLGFYQVVKLLVTPVIVGLEWILYRQRMSAPRALSLLLVCIGVGVACVNDMRINLPGCLAAAAWVPVAAVYKVLWSRISKEEGWSALGLMRRVLPVSVIFTALLVPLIDPPGLLQYEWTAQGAALVAASGVAAFFVNWSGFLVMGACSALTHTILGQLKACVIIIGGWGLFGQSYPPKSIAGAALAICAMVAYTHFNMNEKKPSKHGPVGAACNPIPHEGVRVSAADLASKPKKSPPTMRESSAELGERAPLVQEL